ncbi:hypothetical protein CJ030_MR2G026929 [Morella rubra]|uniref:Pentatricopeptide repeat-containing protein n=1 Tax=Morella rubra TaxID=262757 RepID=A0A6A1WJU1_9ROSI|nr:hypothetical protein CJ030_MR2G026929 [Morella rubra]
MRITKALNTQILSDSNGYFQQTLQSHAAAYGFDYSAYGYLIRHCTNHGLVRQAKQLHARLVIFSVTPSNFLASKLITFYCKSNNLREARCVFDRIPEKIYSLGTLCSLASPCTACTLKC